jgi:hypothetical protein
MPCHDFNLVGGLTSVLAIAVAMSVAPACGSATSEGGLSPSPTRAGSPVASPSRSTTPGTDMLVRCEDFLQQTYTDSRFGFSISCPSNFSWETYSNPYAALFLARVIGDRYLVGDTPGGISISIYHNDVGALRDWIAAHTGTPNGGDPRHFWGSTSNLSDIRVAGRPAVSFDTTSLGPGPPPTGHAVAFVLPDGNVFAIYWSAYAGDYAATLEAVAQHMTATIQV